MEQKGFLGLDIQKVVVHFIAPLTVMLALIAMCYSGVRLLETIVVMPYLEGIAPASRRELGLLETLHNVLILVAFIVAVRSAIRTRVPLARAFFAVFAAGSLFMLLEEMDYGLHYYEWIAGVPPEQSAEVRNIHNQGLSSPMKSVGNLLQILGFVVAPLALWRVRLPWVRYFVPSAYFLLTMLCALITSRVGHTFEHRAEAIGFANNIGEFREAVTYYMAMLYVIQLSRKAPPGSDAARTRAEAGQT
jgi:hypothetical protein